MGVSWGFVHPWMSVSAELPGKGLNTGLGTLWSVNGPFGYLQRYLCQLWPQRISPFKTSLLRMKELSSPHSCLGKATPKQFRSLLQSMGWTFPAPAPH